jgi:hypothetical protein
MADPIAELASKSGISLDQAKKGLGTVLSTIKEKLPADMFSQVQSAVPDADNVMASAEAGKESPSRHGVLGAVTDLAGKIFGGSGGAPAMMGNLQGLGFSADQLQKFLPNVLEFLKARLPANVLEKVSALFPTHAGAGG